ncbi:hypothetical protein FA13DRAFT_1709953 [Coprinellus micaceus]|uniref:Uncharacterized protein n=1 Tax=Coprinellus micaceus TaxID=71717 RepID=A0A4Y7TAT4_COPMI|nr:hypothetical protein FA13DRAFT_1709953 [Coprinellus micaceus]
MLEERVDDLTKCRRQKKYIGGGDSDPEVDVPQTVGLKNLPKRGSQVANTGSASAHTAQTISSGEELRDDTDDEGEDKDKEEPNATAKGDSIGERVRSRRGNAKTAVREFSLYLQHIL